MMIRATKTRRASPARPSLELPADSPMLRLTPTAWAKLLFLRDAGETEVGGFGISAADDPLLIEDVQLVRQTCDVASVCFDDASVADFFDRQVDAGRTLDQTCRIWVHTHPGRCAEPSATDHETFARVFGRCQWAVMFILAKGGATYARLQFNVGPGGSLLLPVEVDYRCAFTGSDTAGWLEEYRANVEPLERLMILDNKKRREGSGTKFFDPLTDGFDLWHDPLEDETGFLTQARERLFDGDQF